MIRYWDWSRVDMVETECQSEFILYTPLLNLGGEIVDL